MKITVIFSPDEKNVLLHSLFENNQELQEVLKNIIAEFENADLDKLIKARDAKLSLLELIETDKERYLPQLAEFYEDCYGLKHDSPEQKRLKAGIFYTLCKIMLVRCNYRKGFNKLLYAASFPELPHTFTPLYLFRLGSIYIEQGKIQEAADILTLSEHRCKSYKNDPVMRRLALLISYQLLRVNVIRGNLIEAKMVHDNTERKLNGEENIIFDSLRGYYYRWAGDTDEGYKILNAAYQKYRDNAEVKETYVRSWFNIMYQLSFCLLKMRGKDYQPNAHNMIRRAYAVTSEFNYRNLGYCENMLGLIVMDKGDLKNALEHFEKANALFEKYTDYRNMARTKRNLGTVFAKMKNYYEAMKNLNQALDYEHHTQLEIGIIKTLLKKTDLQIEMVQYDKAREYLIRIKSIKLPFKHPLTDAIAKREDVLANIDLITYGLIGESESIRLIKNEIESHAKISDPLLLIGESGTGKRFIAVDIHKKSKRKGPFEVVNCQLISRDALDKEIFGYRDATTNIPGALEKAERGTLFIEEIYALPSDLQARLSRFIDEKRVPSLNGGKEKDIDVKIIFACKCNNLENQIANGVIRRDFYNRISEFIIKVPPLRKRRGDIRKLAEHFYVRQCKELNRKICGIKACAMNLLEFYPWPDNVGELKKTIKSCVVKLGEDRLIDREDVIKSLDNRMLNLPINYKKAFENTTKDIGDKEIITRLKSLEEKLPKEPEEPSRTRTTDSHSIINEAFKIIQEQGPVRKSEVIAGCPDAEKSFHHWINILKDKYEVITVGESGNFNVYKAVSIKILNKKLKAGELLKNGVVFSVVEGVG